MALLRTNRRAKLRVIKTSRILQPAFSTTSAQAQAAWPSSRTALTRGASPNSDRAKKLRYASEFFSELFAGRKHRKRYQAFIAALGDLQARLGDLNDIPNEHDIAAELASVSHFA